ncbi:MAG: hypothetical protein NC400_12970 [Clostridium sp.]|nr:hypothetical protein [Clostridium sp.]
MYLLSILCVIIMTGFMGIMVGGVASLVNLFDVISLLLLLLLTIPILVSGGLLKDFNNAFRLGMGKRAASSLIELKRAQEAVSLAIKVFLASAGFIFAVSGALILFTVDDPAALGPNIAVDLIVLVYSFAVVLVLLPLQSRLNVKIQEFVSEKE